MPIKRVSKKINLDDRPVPPRRAKVTRRAAAASEPKKPTARFLSSDEKRSLILAHAAMREKHQVSDPTQVMSLWAGVLVTMAVVLVGYWWAVTPLYANALKDTAMQKTAEQLNETASRAKESASNDPLLKQLEEVNQRFQDLQVKSLTEKAALDKVANHLNGVTSTRPDLFQGLTASSTEDTTTSTSQTE